MPIVFLISMKIFDLFVEPANYTLDAIKNVHSKIGVDYAFIYDKSAAGDAKKISAPILSKMGFWGRLKFAWRTLKNYDAFIINGYTGSTCLLFILLDMLFFKKPYAIDSDTELRIPANPIKRLVKTVFLRLIFGRQYAYGFAGGYHDHVKLFTHYGMSRERVFVNGMVIDNEKYARVVVPNPGAVFRFGFIGRLIPLKQVARMIEAFKMMQADSPCEFVIVGDGVEREYLESIAADRVNIVFKGALFGEDKINALHGMNAILLYSTEEQWGLVLNEALAAGVPCIVSDKVGARNDLILGESPTGIVVPYDNTEALVEAMKDMASNREKWRMFSNAAIERMKSWNYDMQFKAIKDFCQHAKIGEMV